MPRGWVRRIQDLLDPDEDVELAIAEHRIASPKPLTTAVISCMTKRLLLARWGVLSYGRGYSAIAYDKSTQIICHKGFHYSRVHFGVSGGQRQMEEWEQWFWGLDHNDIRALMSFMESKNVGAAISTQTQNTGNINKTK